MFKSFGFLDEEILFKVTH